MRLCSTLLSLGVISHPYFYDAGDYGAGNDIYDLAPAGSGLIRKG